MLELQSGQFIKEKTCSFFNSFIHRNGENFFGSEPQKTPFRHLEKISEHNPLVDIPNRAFYNLSTSFRGRGGGKMPKLNPEEKATDKTEAGVPRNIARIGSSLHLKGELSGEEDLFIEGKVKGKIELLNSNLLIGRSAKVEADIQVKNITIEGSVQGNVYALEKVFISEEGQMIGDIIAPRISIMDGAQFKGSIKMGEKDAVLPRKEKDVIEKENFLKDTD